MNGKDSTSLYNALEPKWLNPSYSLECSFLSDAWIKILCNVIIISFDQASNDLD